jgi:hypothetical protein
MPNVPATPIGISIETYVLIQSRIASEDEDKWIDADRTDVANADLRGITSSGTSSNRVHSALVEAIKK